MKTYKLNLGATLSTTVPSCEFIIPSSIIHQMCKSKLMLLFIRFTRINFLKSNPACYMFKLKQWRAFDFVLLIIGQLITKTQIIWNDRSSLFIIILSSFEFLTIRISKMEFITLNFPHIPSLTSPLSVSPAWHQQQNNATRRLLMMTFLLHSTPHITERQAT